MQRRRMSVSTMSTFLPELAMAHARLVLTWVLPSSMPVEVTTIVFTFSSMETKRMLANSVFEALLRSGFWNWLGRLRFFLAMLPRLLRLGHAAEDGNPQQLFGVVARLHGGV